MFQIKQNILFLCLIIYIYIYINIIKFYIVHSLYIDYIHCIFEHIYIYINIYINIVTSWRQSNAQLRLAQLFPSETDPIVPKWHWHDCLQVRLAQLFPRETSKVVPKWTGTIVPKWILTFCFVFCFAVFSLARFFTSEFHLGRIVPCTRVY